jgi:hypothetical protein
MGTEKKGKPGKYYFLFFICFVLIFLFYVWESAEVITLSYQINELKKEVVLLENKNCHLKAKLYRYANLANIDKIGREEKGMVSAEHENIIFLNVNSKQNAILANKANFTPREGTKGDSKNSHYQFYPDSNLYSYRIGN